MDSSNVSVLLSNVSTSKKEQVLAESLSGSVAGAALTIAKTLVKFPLDTATVRLQMPSQEYSILRLAELFQDCYRGVWTPLLANIPAGAVFFAVKDAVVKSFDDDAPSWWTTSVAVAAAQIPYWLVRNPSEVVKTRQQAGIAGYSQGVSSLQAYKQVWQEALDSVDEDENENVSMASRQFIPQQEPKDEESSSLSRATAQASRIAKAYYLGFGENIVYAYPADVVKFLIYDGFKKQQRRKLSPAEGAVAGAVATGIAQFVTTPLDVIRNRIMARQTKQQERLENQTSNDNSDGANKQQQQQPSYIEALVQLGRDEGLSGLFAGAAPRVGKAILSGAIQFATYEETKQKMADLFARPR
jgi:solute carrier family 25 (mitochondrial S-adenosylmethionine transporter), member 26